jgi:hypothetical protein
MAVFPTGLFVMTALTKAAPVAPIPEKNRISPVRFDMVDHGCLDVASVLQTFLTEPVLRHGQNTFALPLPRRTIATAAG